MYKNTKKINILPEKVMKIFNFQYSILNLFIIKLTFQKYNIHRFM